MIRSFTVVFIAVIIVCIAENLENTEYRIQNILIIQYKHISYYIRVKVIIA
jgi:hypothetical protein